MWFFFTFDLLIKGHFNDFQVKTKAQTACKLQNLNVDLVSFDNVFKEAKSATMNIFSEKIFSFQIICKSRIKLCFHNNLFTIAETARKSELLYKIDVCSLLLVIICVPPIIIDS